jgi:two-component system invasion response regulator UvrY
MEPLTILIVDDHMLVRQTWSFILSTLPQYHVIGEAGSGEEAIELSKKLQPNIVLMDINLPGINGIDATKEVLQFAPHSKVIGISLHTEPSYARRMMQVGALGYVSKNSSKAEMFEAITQVFNGRKYICHAVKENLSKQIFEQEDLHNEKEELTPRETEIIALLKTGCTSGEIATQLGISIQTVQVHRQHILKKLKLKNVAELINFTTKASTVL